MSLGILLFVLIMISFTFFVYAEKTNQDKLISMNFKGADIRDVLRTIAELAGINLVTDGSVEGVITLHLNDISFTDALNLITRTHNLDYRWDGNTVIVASPEKIELMYSEIITNNVIINHTNLEKLKGIINGIYPDLKIQLDNINNQLILVGKKDIVNGAIDIINRVDIPDDKVNKAFNVYDGDADELKDSIQKIFPDLDIQLDQRKRQLLITGKEEEVNKALILAQNLDVGEEILTEVKTIDYGELANIQEVISKIYPDLSLQANKLKREIIIHGKSDDVRRAIKLINKLDNPRRQVLIEARVEEVSRNELLDIGVNPEHLSRINFIKDSNGSVEGLQFTWPEFLKVLESKGSAQTLANPRLMTLNGEEAKLLIGDRIPIVVEEVEEGQVTSTVEYIEAGITLEFKPWITSDNYISLEVRPQVSSIGESTYNSLPTINTREAETKIRLRDGQTFAIGGLIQDDVIESISRVPLLSDIPILGEIFKSKDTNNIKTEIIIFITPHIIQEAEVDNEDSNKVQGEDHAKKEKLNDCITNKLQGSDNQKYNDTLIDNTKKRKLVGLSREEIEQILNKSQGKRGSKGSDLPAFINIKYSVKTGDTLNNIARKFGLSAEDISFVNGLDREPASGDLLTIPIPQNRLYRSKKGETIKSVAKKFEVDLIILKEINNIMENKSLEPGTIIVLPEDIVDKR